MAWFFRSFWILLIPLACGLGACSSTPRYYQQGGYYSQGKYYYNRYGYNYGPGDGMQQGSYAAARYTPRKRHYHVPGTPDDPWGPYIRSAARRFSVPEQWIRAVMKQESGGKLYRGDQLVVSSAGAMGLMQLMPDTYATLQARYGLGPDPYEPRDNILAGTAYIKEMYDKYGAPGFLAAYNAGPQRLDDYLQNGRPLPNETVNYVASITPNLGTRVAMSGPLAAYANGQIPEPPVQYAAYSQDSNGCYRDPNAAYDPSAPCIKSAPTAQIKPAPSNPSACPWRDPNAAFDAPCLPRPTVQVAARQAACPWRDPNAAFDAPCPTAPPVTRPMEVASSGGPVSPPPIMYHGSRPYYGRSQPAALPIKATYPRSARQAVSASYATPMVRKVALQKENTSGGWGVQVGAFSSPTLARSAAAKARHAAAALSQAQNTVMPVTRPGGQTLYRARLTGISEASAASACSRLRQRSIGCTVVRP